MFLCPALSDIRTVWTWNQWMNPFEARDLMLQMVGTCPNLTKLNILIGNTRYPDNLLPFGPYSPARHFAPIIQFRDLWVLHSSSVVLNPEILQLLGNLPRLESLAAYSLGANDDGMEDDKILIADLVLSKDSFPLLRHLGIDCVPGTVVSKLWNTPPLVHSLVSVSIQFMPDETELPSNLICTICKGSPHLTDLELDLVKSRETELSSVVKHLRRLPLVVGVVGL